MLALSSAAALSFTPAMPLVNKIKMPSVSMMESKADLESMAKELK